MSWSDVIDYCLLLHTCIMYVYLFKDGVQVSDLVNEQFVGQAYLLHHNIGGSRFL